MTDPTKNNRHRKSGPLRHEFGTFGGVFTPAILTILGVIMFMRANFVVGQAGILGAVVILLIAKTITFTTSLSIGAISTNIQVRGGGSYFLISRVLGAEFGGAIGIALFFALALSVPFYILGFTEALVRSYPSLVPHFQKITFTTAVVLFFLSYVGAGWAIRTQYLIMFILLLAIVAFLTGTFKLFSFDTFFNNLYPGYTASNLSLEGSTLFTFWTIFAIYFPAVTGIDAGLNMSGDLKDPGHSIPRGTLTAVFVGFIVYLTQILLSGGAYPRDDLIALPFDLLRDNALFGWSLVVTLGVVAATLSSALSSYLGAPRVLQAVARDRIIQFLFYFGKGSSKGDEPRRALILTFIITLAVLSWAGNAAGGAALNVVASIITMFFLYSYGMINLAAFIEDYGDNPSFRPRFHFFHWGTALVGAAGCATVAFLISWQAALLAVLLIMALLWYINTRHLRTAFGDARRGFVFNEVRKSLLRLARMTDDPKNWRPNILVFAGNPVAHDPLVSYAAWMESKRGLLYLAYILVGDFDELASRRTGALNQLEKYCEDKNFEAFPLAIVADSVEEGISTLLQAATIGPIHPNLAVFGWSDKPARLNSYLNELRKAKKLGMSIVLIDSDSMPLPGAKKRIDIWWRGQKNGGLMLLLAFLISENWEWHNTEIRLLRVVDNDAGREPSLAALQELVDSARVEATVQTIVSEQPFADILYQHSTDAICVMLGFEVPEAGSEEAWYNTYRHYVDTLPTTILVNSHGEEGLLA